MNGYGSEIEDCLIKASEATHRNTGANKIDYVKNATFLFGIFAASVHNGVTNGHISSNQAVYASLAVSLANENAHDTIKRIRQNAKAEYLFGKIKLWAHISPGKPSEQLEILGNLH